MHNLESILSERERTIARLLAWGNVQKEIADKLYIAPSTVATHMKNIYRKLNIRKETDLCRYWIFYEYGIADNPLKKVIAVFFLALTTTMIFSQNNAVRVFRTAPARQATRTVRSARSRRYENVFDLHLALTT